MIDPTVGTIKQVRTLEHMYSFFNETDAYVVKCDTWMCTNLATKIVMTWGNGQCRPVPKLNNIARLPMTVIVKPCYLFGIAKPILNYIKMAIQQSTGVSLDWEQPMFYKCTEIYPVPNGGVKWIKI
ncbi:hypothetical protein [zander parvovirus]|uniref:Uncharacterized protein n=1 Tax=zander parvovirus TaxID=3071220 RepID=A0AA49H460_9VIRU|nr:hypothetical protein QKV37_gp3 [Parvovirinae sp.]UNJ12757.1 hypothetical protein [zander parvovirus]